MQSDSPRECILHRYTGEGRPYALCSTCSVIWVTRQSERYHSLEWECLRAEMLGQTAE